MHPNLKTVTIWSDSCISQNKNSFMSAAILEVMSQHRTQESVTQTYGEPGHSVIQEMDNIHSQIERRFKLSEINSPVGLLKSLKKINPKNSSIIIQLRDFRNYQQQPKTRISRRFHIRYIIKALIHNVQVICCNSINCNLNVCFLCFYMITLYLLY